MKEDFRLITFAQSLYGMDRQRLLLNQLYEKLRLGGGMVIIGGSGQAPAHYKITSQKDDMIKNLVNKYLGPQRHAGITVYKQSGLNWEQDIFPNSKFSKFEKRIYQTKVVRNSDQELGILYSMSWTRRDFFGNKVADFETKFKHAIAQINP